MAENKRFLNKFPINEELFNDSNSDDKSGFRNKEDNKDLQKESDPEFSKHTVMVAIKMLKCFEGPGVDYPVYKLLKYGEKVKIVEEKNDSVDDPVYKLLKYGEKVKIVEEKNDSGAFKWGRIDSDISQWIPLNFCEDI